VPGETPDITKRGPLTDLLAKATAAIAEELAKIAAGGVSILMPVPDILLHPGRVPGDPNGGSALF
jgi:hypothetical protein